MKWAILAILIIFLVIYFTRKSSVTLTKDQAELVTGLIHKELNNLEDQRQGLIDNAAAEGKTAPLESLFSNIPCETKEEKDEIDKIKKELRKKYGEDIPVDALYRIMKEFDPDEESVWSDNPGCFERHLQRREGNILFPPERRIVSKNEIDEARQKDHLEQEQFAQKVKSFVERSKNHRDKNIGKTIKLDRAQLVLKEIQDLLKEAATIGGPLGGYVQALENMENNIIEILNKAVPDGADLLEQAQSLSISGRIPYFAQTLRNNSPIYKDEQIPTLLSEDLETIAFAGYISRAFAPDYRPNEADIRKFLENALTLGFSKESAEQIIAAWNEKPYEETPS